MCPQGYQERSQRTGKVRWVEHSVVRTVNVIVNDVVEVERNQDTMKPVRPWATETASRYDTEQWLMQNPEVKFGVSQQAAELLYEMYNSRVPHQRASWDDTFLQIAHDASKRSPDAQTQVGAVVVSQDHHILSVGYNGWMPGIDDSMIPNIRPLKHTWVIHAELNALLNCGHRPRGATLYCTHKPCLDCFFDCVVAGIAELVYTNGSVTTNTASKDVEHEVAQFLARNKIKVRGVDFTPTDG